MRTSLKLIGALVLLSGLNALGQSKTAKKRPPAAHGAAVQHAPAATPARREAPTVNLNSRPPAGASEASADTGGAAPTRGPTRIDFDDRLIQGQTNKSGAVYLYDRKELKTRSMIKKRDSFRDEIVGSLYDG
jgi:hypothetical protein